MTDRHDTARCPCRFTWGKGIAQRCIIPGGVLEEAAFDMLLVDSAGTHVMMSGMHGGLIANAEIICPHMGEVMPPAQCSARLAHPPA